MEKTQEMSHLMKIFIEKAEAKYQKDLDVLLINTRTSWSIFLEGHDCGHVDLDSLKKMAREKRNDIINRNVSNTYKGLTEKISELKWLWENQP